MDDYLVMADADRVQEYVFTPHELRLIRGGSALQTELNREFLPALVMGPGQRTISKNGGTVLAAFPSLAEAETFCAGARSRFRQKTQIATISTALTEYPAGRFEQARSEVQRLLEMKKQERAGSRFIGGGPLWAVCPACGLYPSAGFSSAKRSIAYCEACRRRERASDRRRLLPGGAKPAEDLGSIGRAARPENYIAFLYIDLDRMGEWLPKHAGNDEEKFTKLSETVFQTVTDATKGACQGMVKDGMATHEIFLIGGDDVALAIPADRCFAFLAKFRELYEKQDKLPPFSVGMTIAHSHFPIAEFRRISQELLRSAKAIKGSHSIDYEIVTNSMVERVAATRGERAAQDGRFRTRKPYSLDEFADLERAVRELKQAAPASKVRSLYLIAHRELMQAELDYLTLLGRVDKEARGELLKTIGQGLFQADGTGKESTKAADLAELWEFVRNGTEAGN
jgi:hypothetical protein